ncbi:hypothetical protein PR202_gb09509 [Eleusine coracana subsp. coracana]|uniref:Uncharacterized protein n=1 Tax=Eleusine coracana subsp. coracana TaxID=191504 RepID=A0AAV5EFT4_ELECO|nr:hypothetical protein PR202_gb09509 [Eleusine coracana subsp. coracana]
MDSVGGGGSGAHKAASGSAPSPAPPAPNPTVMLSALMSKRAKLQEELRSIERQVRASPPTFFSLAFLSCRVSRLGRLLLHVCDLYWGIGGWASLKI